MLIEGSNPPKQAPSAATEKEDPVLLPAIARLGMPVLLFGAAFLALIIGLTFLMTPDRFPVQVGDKTVRLSDLEAEEQGLKQTFDELQQRRASLKREEKAPILHQVAMLKEKIVPTGRVLLLIEEVRAGFKTSSTDPISLPRVEVKGDADTITIGGEIKDVGGRSMQILASFVDGLRSIPLILHVSEPEYVTKPLSGGGSVSPFVMTLTLSHD